MEGKQKKSWRERAGQAVCLALLCMVMAGMLFSGKEVIGISAAIHHSKGQGTEEEGERENSAGQKVAYLTFDDGPSVLTKEYLKILKEEDVHATFFLIGQQVDGDLVDVVRQEVKDGHEIGLHTYCHVADKIYCSGETYCQDLEKTKQCLETKLEVSPKLFRFPWGSTNSYVRGYKDRVVEEMKKEGLGYADWNVSGEDSVGCPSPDSILSNVRKDYLKYDDPVILLHDSAACKSTLEALRPLIQELKANGYSFRTLSERERPCHFGEKQ
jgi:Predicted xylanase/chitin deacetylase